MGLRLLTTEIPHSEEIGHGRSTTEVDTGSSFEEMKNMGFRMRLFLLVMGSDPKAPFPIHCSSCAGNHVHTATTLKKKEKRYVKGYIRLF